MVATIKKETSYPQQSTKRLWWYDEEREIKGRKVEMQSILLKKKRGEGVFLWFFVSFFFIFRKAFLFNFSIVCN
jgi:hypothetical protein